AGRGAPHGRRTADPPLLPRRRGVGLLVTWTALARRRTESLLLELDLSRGVVETPPSSPLRVRGRQVPALRALVEALASAERDEHVVGLVAHIGQRPIGLAQSSELREAVLRFRESGKVAVAWTETFGEMSTANVGYHLATAFAEIWLQPT